MPAADFGGESPRTMRTIIFCESLLPLQCPVSLLRWMVGYRQPPASTALASNRNCTAPLAPSVTCGDSSLPEGAMGCVPFHIGLFFGEVPAVNPSVTPTACQLPLAREPFCAVSGARGGFREEGIGKKGEWRMGKKKILGNGQKFYGNFVKNSEIILDKWGKGWYDT